MMTEATPDNTVPSEDGSQPDPENAEHLEPEVSATPEPHTAPAPAKKGLPGWAVGLIIGGSVFLVAIIVGVVVVTSLIANVLKSEPGLTPGTSESPTPTTPESNAPDDPATASGIIALASSAELGGPPVWAAPYLSGWDIAILDQQGINKFESAELGCTFATSQNQQTVDFTTSTDATSTQDLMDTLLDAVTEGSTNAEIVFETTIGLALSGTTEADTIEFAATELTYSLPSGDYSSVLFARSMPHSGSYMYTHLNCVRATIDNGDSPLDQLLDKLSVTPTS